MARWMIALILVSLVVWPTSAEAEEHPANALQVGAGVATCVARIRNDPDEEGIELQGTIHEVTLIDRVRPFAVLHRRAFDPITEPWLARQTFQPPMAFDMVGVNDTPRRREIVQHALDCFDLIYGS